MQNAGVQGADGRQHPPRDRVIPVSIGSVARQSSDGSGIDQKSTSSGRCPSAAAQAYSDSMGSNAPISCFRHVADGPPRATSCSLHRAHYFVVVVKERESLGKSRLLFAYIFHKSWH